MSDEHQSEIMGCVGDTIVKTPNLDALAREGTTFTNAYTNCPICVPARASFATGLHVYQHSCWDNAQPYHGQLVSWGHNLIRSGHEVTSIGKLHYREATDDNGFSREIIPMHVLNGMGDLYGLLRKDLPKRLTASELARDAGPGESTYTNYDREVTAQTRRWLEDKAVNPTEKPWVLYVGLVCPHFPLIAPQEFFDLYDPDTIAMPRQYGEDKLPDHPILQGLANCLNYGDFFTTERIRTARMAYYGLVSFLDDNIGQIMSSLSDTGLEANTRLIYLSDHGDNLGNHGFWGKSTMYEESVRVPLIVRGKGVPKDKKCDTAVSLIDLYPTIVTAAGGQLTGSETDLPGKSLIDIASADFEERTILSEYHAIGVSTGMFMIREGKWKLIHYEGCQPQLFDLEHDPGEINDLAQNPDHKEVLARLDGKLRSILDPSQTNDRAFSDQQAVMDREGGQEAIREIGEYGHTPAPTA